MVYVQYVRNPYRGVDVSESISGISPSRAAGNKPADFSVPKRQVCGSRRRSMSAHPRQILGDAVV